MISWRIPVLCISPISRSGFWTQDLQLRRLGRSYHALFTQSPNVIHTKAKQLTVDFCSVLAEGGPARRTAPGASRSFGTMPCIWTVPSSSSSTETIFSSPHNAVLESIFGVEYQTEGDAFLAQQVGDIGEVIRRVPIGHDLLDIAGVADAVRIGAESRIVDQLRSVHSLRQTLEDALCRTRE